LHTSSIGVQLFYIYYSELNKHLKDSISIGPKQLGPLTHLGQVLSTHPLFASGGAHSTSGEPFKLSGNVFPRVANLSPRLRFPQFRNHQVSWCALQRIIHFTLYKRILHGPQKHDSFKP